MLDANTAPPEGLNDNPTALGEDVELDAVLRKIDHRLVGLVAVAGLVVDDGGRDASRNAALCRELARQARDWVAVARGLVREGVGPGRAGATG